MFTSLVTDERTDGRTNGQPEPPLARLACRKHKGLKGFKGLSTCYSVAYMSQTRDQQRFTISKVAADWDGPMVPQRIMWPSVARANGQLDPRFS